MQVVRAIVHVEEVIRMHNVKSVRFRSFSGPSFSVLGLNTD